MKQGDIVLVPFPFTDLSGNKVRPVLILIATALDVTLSFITTQLQWQEPTDLSITPSNQNGLKKVSLIRLSKLAIIDINLVQGRLGTLNMHELATVHQNLRLLLQL